MSITAESVYRDTGIFVISLLPLLIALLCAFITVLLKERVFSPMSASFRSWVKVIIWRKAPGFV